MDCGIFCVDPGTAASDVEGVAIFESKQKNTRDIAVFRHIDKAIKRFEPDLVHAWLPASVTVPAMSVAAWNKVPAIISYRNEQRFRRGVYYAEFFLAWALASGVVSNTPVERSARPYRMLYERKRGRIIPNAVNLPRDARDADGAGTLPALPDPDGLNRLLFVGRLTRQKNWQCLIRALPLIGSRTDWRLTICGDGEDREELRSLVEALGMTGRVTLLGYRDDARQIMRQSNLLIMPSWYEGMPNVLMEALAMGLPCLASDIPAVRDLVGDRQCLHTFDPASPEALASLIDKAFSNPGMIGSARHTGTLVAKDYSVQKMSERYRSYYADVLTRAKRRPRQPRSTN